ncbi:hypothetical protein [Streptomyces hiroshimensis]|nr:hypothetical protein [Streptomyces hiroshimensis]
MQAGRVGTRISKDLPPGRRRLAETLVALYRHMNPASLGTAAKELESRGYKKDPSEISRYLNGVRLPTEAFVLRLYEAAVARAGTAAVGMTRQQLHAIHAAAEPRLCSTCPRLKRENNELRRSLKQVSDREAGLEAALAAARERASFLPVPSPEGDRQELARDVAAANHVAQRTGDLHRKGKRSAALALLRETTRILTPAESAAALVLLRRQQHKQLAETLILTYGRDQPHDAVIRTAVKLHDYGLPDDAGALLRAAMK